MTALLGQTVQITVQSVHDSVRGDDVGGRLRVHISLVLAMDI